MDIREKILQILREKNCPPQYPEQMMELVGISKGEERIFRSILEAMVKDGQLVMTRKKKYALPEKYGMVTGRLQGNPKGFAFLIPDNPEEEDVFIAPCNLGGAMHNDRVMVRVLKNYSGSGKSREGEVYKILERANTTVIGTFEKERNFGFVVPDDPRIYQDIFIPPEEINGAESGYKVVAQITKWPEKRRNPEGRIIEVLGHKDETGTDILSIIRQFNLPQDFPEDVLEAAKEIPQKISEQEIERRKDFRHLKIVTIDGADAKDLDDAVSVEVLNNGNYLLGVHIADVSYYVKEGSVLDREAFARGTSVYLVDRVIPMLPKELSNGICSLNPHEDRLTLSVLMEIDKEGRVVDYRIEESVIRSRERMTYEDVTAILERNDPVLMERYKDLVEDFRIMEQLCKILHKRRVERGSIDFDLEEAKINLDSKGRPVSVKPYEQGIANQIIEEFMLICNETIAEYVYWSSIPFIYRIHEEPDIEKMLEFNEFIHNFGYRLKGIGGKIHPKALQVLLDEIRGTKEENIISTVMLRSLQRARYSEQNVGHFGLAAPCYCHFTSPIRRYPDLMIHRIIKDLINNRLNPGRIAKLEARLPEIARHCSKKELIADEAERETEKLKKAEFMLDKIGMEFDGIISGVTGYGIYVQLDNTVEGLVRISTMEDDYYVYDEKHYCLIGERTRKIYRLGDQVRVKVLNASVATRTVDFLLVTD